MESAHRTDGSTDLLLAFCGLGRMGSPIATRLRGAGYHLRVYDLVPEVGARFEKEGFEVAHSVAEAASGADVLFLCLPNAAAVRSAVEGEAGLLQARPAPSLCIDLTSSDPQVSRELSARLAKEGMSFVDAPVSGGVAGARAGNLTVMAGGEPNAVEQVRALTQSFAGRVFRAGPAGAGDAAKAVNNALSAASLTLTAEALVLAGERGYPSTEVVEAVNHSGARSQNSELKFPQHIVSGSFAAGFSMALMTKDVGTAVQMAARSGYPAPRLLRLHGFWLEAEPQLGPQADFTEIARYLEQAKALPFLGRGGDEDLEGLVNRTEAALRSFTAELLGLARAAGLDPQFLLAIVNSGSGRNEITRRLEANPANLPALLGD